MQARFVRIFVLVAGLALVASACGKYSINNLRALKLFGDANKLYQKSDYKNAAAKYEEVIRLSPELGYAYFFLGNSYDNLYKPARKGEPENDAYLEKAVANYRKATETLVSPTDQREVEFRKLSFEYLIASYGSDKLNDLSQAEPIAKQLIALEPNEPINYQAIGKLYEEAGRYDEAEAMFQKAVDVKPNDANGYLVMAGYYTRQGMFDKTMAALEMRAKIEPNNPEAWHGMATYYWEKAWKDLKLPLATKKEYVAKGIAADDKALALNAEYVEALTYKNILLRIEAGMEKDAARQKELLKQADELRDKAIDLQKKQQTGAGARKSGG